MTPLRCAQTTLRSPRSCSARSAAVSTNVVIGTGTSTLYGWLANWNTDPIAPGSYSVRAVAFDAAGNSKMSTPVTVIVDRTAPVTAVIVPSTDNTVVSNTAVLDASSTDANGVAKVEFRVSGGTFNNALIGPAGLTSFGWLAIWNTAAVPNGTYTVRSVATDRAGNVATSPPRTIRIQH